MTEPEGVVRQMKPMPVVVPEPGEALWYFTDLQGYLPFQNLHGALFSGLEEFELGRTWRVEEALREDEGDYFILRLTREEVLWVLGQEETP